MSPGTTRSCIAAALALSFEGCALAFHHSGMSPDGVGLTMFAGFMLAALSVVVGSKVFD